MSASAVQGSETSKRSLEEDGKAGEGSGVKRQKQDLTGLPTRQYLDQTVVPILLQVIQSMAHSYFPLFLFRQPAEAKILVSFCTCIHQMIS